MLLSGRRQDFTAKLQYANVSRFLHLSSLGLGKIHVLAGHGGQDRTHGN